MTTKISNKGEFDSFISSKGFRVIDHGPVGRAGSSAITPLIKRLNPGESLFFWAEDWDLRTPVKSAVSVIDIQLRRNYKVTELIEESSGRSAFIVTFNYFYQ